MNYAIIDTETSGLFDFSKPADADGQPRLAHLAMILTDGDTGETAAHEFFVRPEGWEMSDVVAAIHGLTTERLLEIGAPVSDALKAYAKVIDDGYVVVAFNAQYDTKIMRGEMRRAGIDDRFERTPNICVMRALTDICKIPKANGRGFKFPKLTEACAHFEIEPGQSHTANADALACFALFRKLNELGACPQPAVHYAKNQPAKDVAA